MQLGRIEGLLRSFDLKEEKANQELVLKAIQAGLLLARMIALKAALPLL